MKVERIQSARSSISAQFDATHNTSRHLALYTDAPRSSTERVTSANILLVDAPLADGTYDAFVVTAEPDERGAISIEVTITTGPHKGELHRIRATRVGRNAFDLVGLACRLVIDGGVPRIDW
jgi:hypothetical protein